MLILHRGPNKHGESGYWNDSHEQERPRGDAQQPPRAQVCTDALATMLLLKAQSVAYSLFFVFQTSVCMSRLRVDANNASKKTVDPR